MNQLGYKYKDTSRCFHFWYKNINIQHYMTSTFKTKPITTTSSMTQFSVFPFTTLTAVRLVGGSNIYKGRVEIRVNNQWKGFCGDGWSLSNARVVCSQLKLGLVGQAPTGYMFGEPEGLYYHRPSCGGYERSLGICFMEAIDNCTSGYAGAVCSLPGRSYHNNNSNNNNYMYPGGYFSSLLAWK